VLLTSCLAVWCSVADPDVVYCNVSHTVPPERSAAFAREVTACVDSLRTIILEQASLFTPWAMFCGVGGLGFGGGVDCYFGAGESFYLVGNVLRRLGFEV
jgi:hypothetical protein